MEKRPAVLEQGRIEVTEATEAVDDPWKHRTEGMRCKTCISFVRKERDRSNHSPTGPSGWLGRCRKHAPTLNGYPVVFEMDWCGDHKLDENKL